MINLAIIGFGYWGPNMVRNFNSHPDAKVKYVVDLSDDRLNKAKALYPSITTTKSANDIDETEIEAVVIATPVFTHFELAKHFLQKGKHVLLEKPMSSTSDEAKELIDLAEKNNCILMVDHTFLYTGAVMKIKEIIKNKELGNLQYFDSTRINLGLLQPDINVLWDLAPHDISILNHIYPKKPYSVQATGISHTKNDIENMAFLTINYEDNFIAHFNCSWSSPVKIRQTLIGGDEKMIVYNDMEATEKVKVYDKGFTVKNQEEKRKILVDYRVGDIYIPKVEMTEALSLVATDFIQSIHTNKTPVSSAIIGLNVVEVLEASSESLKHNGKEIKL